MLRPAAVVGIRLRSAARAAEAVVLALPRRRSGGSGCPLQQRSLCRHYFTNTDEMKKDDPYAQLGLQWGDATSTKDIKDAFRKKARELHPDVNTKDSPEQALKKFQQLQKAYQTLMGNADDAEDGIEEWRFAIWRGGDRIAQDRTDVAGMARKRPAQPASKGDVWAAKQIGHPDGRGTVSTARAEYLGAGKTVSSSVGTGKNKWVTPKEFKPWNPEEAKKVRASNFASDNNNNKKGDK